MSEGKEIISVSKHTMKRLPVYLSYLKSINDGTIENISSPVIARALNLNEVQVRKDLASVSSTGGKPKTGFDLLQLINDIENVLGYNNVNEAVVVGVGNLGKALLKYSGFEECGVRITAAFEKNPELLGEEIGGKTVFSVSRLQNLCERMKIHIGIITVPAEEAQEICDILVDSGIRGIWNFAPVKLNVPDNVAVRDENLGVSLSLLSMQMKEIMKKNV